MPNNHHVIQKSIVVLFKSHESELTNTIIHSQEDSTTSESLTSHNLICLWKRAKEWNFADFAAWGRVEPKLSICISPPQQCAWFFCDAAHKRWFMGRKFTRFSVLNCHKDCCGANSAETFPSKTCSYGSCEICNSPNRSKHQSLTRVWWSGVRVPMVDQKIPYSPAHHTFTR